MCVLILIKDSMFIRIHPPKPPTTCFLSIRHTLCKQDHSMTKQQVWRWHLLCSKVKSGTLIFFYILSSWVLTQGHIYLCSPKDKHMLSLAVSDERRSTLISRTQPNESGLFRVQLCWTIRCCHTSNDFCDTCISISITTHRNNHTGIFNI